MGNDRSSGQKPSPFVEVTTSRGVLSAKLVGPSIGQHEATPILENVIRAMEGLGSKLRSVVLDFADVSFLNSTGLAACIEIRNRAHTQGVQVVAYRLNDDLTALFKMVKVERLYTVANTPEELKQALAS